MAPSILQNFKKILRADPELWRCAIFRPKMTHLSWINFFVYKPLLLFSSTYWPFSLCKILTKFLQWIQHYEASFLGPKWFIALKENFFEKKLISLWSNHRPLSSCKIFKKILEAIQSYEDVQFFGPKMAHMSWTKLFGTNHYYYFHLPIDPFQWKIFLKICLQWIQSYEDAPFWGPKWSLSLNIFLENY